MSGHTDKRWPRLDAIGFETVLDRIYGGESQSSIARSLSIDSADLNRWLHQNPQSSARVREAMHASAEAWLDKGLDMTERACAGEVDPNAAKAYAQECARRAAIRNPQYRERSEITHVQTVQVLDSDDLRTQLAALEAQTGMLKRLGLALTDAGLAPALGRVIEHKPVTAPVDKPVDNQSSGPDEA